MAEAIPASPAAPRHRRGPRRHQRARRDQSPGSVICRATRRHAALDDVTFDIGHGHVHALLGGNGSGKSTLIKILAGVHQGERGGTIEVGERPGGRRSMDPAIARALGLRFVHQNPAVFGDLTIAENLAIGHGFPTGPARPHSGGTSCGERRAADRPVPHEGHPGRSLGDLRPADRTMVAITRALQDDDDIGDAILVLDEPTSALPDSEVQLLMDNSAGCALAGQTILYVSHRLDEIIEIADDVTVLRDGRHVVTRPPRGSTRPAHRADRRAPVDRCSRRPTNTPPGPNTTCRSRAERRAVAST